MTSGMVMVALGVTWVAVTLWKPAGAWLDRRFPRRH